MLVRIIGGHGGVSPGFRATSYLIDGKLLIDAGSVASGIKIEEQAMIDNILISHAHLDHISDLAFLSDNCFGMKKSPFEVHTSNGTKNGIMTHLLNDVLWPDFTKLPSIEKPTIHFNTLVPNVKTQIGNYLVTAVPVNHQGEAYGFIIEKGNHAILFTQDTGPTEEIWKVAHSTKNLKAIFTEVSFPNFLQGVADASQHHTPQSIKKEIEKMPKDIQIFLGHLKPNFQAKLFEEIADLGFGDRITMIGSDDTSFIF